MKKSDLKFGNVIENGRGYRYLYNSTNEKILINLSGLGYVPFSDYNEQLRYRHSSLPDVNLDIVKVYEDYTCTKVLWERKEKPVLTEAEKAILRSLPKEYKYIARDKNGDLCIYSHPVEKDRIIWRVYSKYEDSISFEITVFGHLFQFIKWEDENAYSIEELLDE